MQQINTTLTASRWSPFWSHKLSQVLQSLRLTNMWYRLFLSFIVKRSPFRDSSLTLPWLFIWDESPSDVKMKSLCDFYVTVTLKLKYNLVMTVYWWRDPTTVTMGLSGDLPKSNCHNGITLESLKDVNRSVPKLLRLMSQWNGHGDYRVE